MTTLQFSRFSSVVKLPGFKDYIDFLGIRNILKSLYFPLVPFSLYLDLSSFLSVSVSTLAPSFLFILRQMILTSL